MAIIGIDLGTSNSAAAVLRGGRPVIIPSAEDVSLGGKAFPSYVAITKDGQMLVGEPARRQAAANPEETATAFKRRMGRRETVRLRDPEFTPEQLSVWIDPAPVLEVVGAEFTVSPVHCTARNLFREGSGLAIRFPRFTGRHRTDKGPEDATTVDKIAEMYRRARRRV